MIFSGFVIVGHASPSACVGVSQWEAATTVDDVLAAAGAVLRGADAAGDDAVTAGDVAAGAGCGVAGVLT
jgi:hypothetical protein